MDDSLGETYTDTFVKKAASMEQGCGTVGLAQLSYGESYPEES